jgi:hypothetical protein
MADARGREGGGERKKGVEKRRREEERGRWWWWSRGIRESSRESKHTIGTKTKGRMEDRKRKGRGMFFINKGYRKDSSSRYLRGFLHGRLTPSCLHVGGREEGKGKTHFQRLGIVARSL